jgi:hypothetical protein
MKKSMRWGSFVRRIRIFYFFLAIIAILFLLYYYYYIPANQSEFNDRATRELKRLVHNFFKKSEDLDSVFSQAMLDSNDFKNKKGGYQKLYENIKYEVDTTGKAAILHPAIIDTSDGWSIMYPVRNSNWKVFVRMNDFAKQLFELRSDIFDSYQILSADTPSQSEWNIVFQQGDITSGHLRIDTLGRLQKNSDLSAIIDLNISGNSWKLFFRPFHFDNKTFAFTGLISKKKYLSYIRSTPVKFIATCIIVLLIILILLPFIKVYLLSPNEIINSADVLFNTVSIFLGTSVILMILMYLYIYGISEQSFHNRMKDLAKQMKDDMETEFDSASAQLDYYTRTYNNLSVPEKKVLYYDTSNKEAQRSLDYKFCPLIYPGMTRVLWVDSAGNTLAKWNPFTFNPPLSKVTGYEFFEQLKEAKDRNDLKNHLIVYPGKSNTTGEYQVYIARADEQAILTKNDSVPVRSIGILLATPLNCNIHPVLPPGFGFCVIDLKGNVLMHSDPHRNLSENILEETRENNRLVTALNYRSSVMIENAVLYGRQQDLFVKPIKGQSLSLIIFFDKKSIIHNVSRLLHFSIACLLYLFIAMAVSVLISTYATSGNPKKIKFHLNKIEWIRPSETNKYSYQFTRKFFAWMFILNSAIFLFILAAKLDVRIILYLSLLAPLYGVGGFIASRKHFVNKFRLKESRRSKLVEDAIERIFIDTKATWVIVILLNVFLFKIASTGNFITIAIIQLVFLFLLVYQYRQIVLKLPEKNKATEEMSWNTKPIEREYLFSLNSSLLLISFLPVLGITVYAFFSEKIQYKKKKQIFAAEQYDQRYEYLKTELSKYKPEVGARLTASLGTLLNKKSIYLSDRDRIFIDVPNNKDNRTLYDEPYRYLADYLYQHTLGAFGEFTINNYASDRDTSWQFTNEGDSIVLQYKTNREDVIKVTSAYENPLYNFFHVLFPGGLIFVLIIFLFIFFELKLIKSTMTRLFLLTFFRKTRTDQHYIEKFFLTTPKDSSYCQDVTIPHPVTMDFFKREERFDVIVPYDEADYLKKRDKYFKRAEKKLGNKEDYILQMTHCFAPVYEKIWMDQSEQERFFLFDLARDGYSNYKNADIIFRLINKGILVPKNFRIQFFSLSFRNYVLGKKETAEIEDLKDKFATGGIWQSIRIPFLMLLGGFLVFFIITQNEVAHDLTALITSIAALGPFIIQLIGKGFSKKSE